MSSVKDAPANRKKCVCPKCPSYPVCGSELLYCSIGKSECGIKAAGCVCNMCAVWVENKLKSLYFCDKDIIDEGGNKILMRKKGSEEDSEFYQTVADIKNISASGHSIVRSMGSRGITVIPFKRHPRMAAFSITLAIIHGTLGIALYL